MCCIYTTSVSPVANIFRPQGEPRSRRPAEWLEHYVTEGGLQLSILFVVSPSVCPSVRPSVRCRSTLSKPWRSETAVPMSMKLVVCILRSGDKTSWSEILNFGPCAERDHPELSSVGTAPLIRSRPWRFINLFTYLLSYLDDPPRRGVLIFLSIYVCHILIQLTDSTDVNQLERHLENSLGYAASAIRSYVQ